MWLLKEKNTENMLSPWHDIDFKSSNQNENYFSGIITNYKGNAQIMEVQKNLEYNPVMQRYDEEK